jgi:hypothetical protein
MRTRFALAPPSACPSFLRRYSVASFALPQCLCVYLPKLCSVDGCILGCIDALPFLLRGAGALQQQNTAVDGCVGVNQNLRRTQWHCVDGLDFPNWATHRCPETATHYVHRMRLQLAEVLVTQNAYT